MKKGEMKKRTYHSMKDFEKKFFPRSQREKATSKPTDAQALGICLAKESLEKIKGKLAN